MTDCIATSAPHPAQYSLQDGADEDGTAYASCREHLADLVEWRLVNQAPFVSVAKIEDPS